MLKKDNNKDISKKEIINKFQREINSLLNKIAESNVSLLVPDMFKKIEEFDGDIKDNFILFDLITKISLKLLLNQEITNLPITSCICSFLSLMHIKFGNNFIYFYLKILFEKISYFSDVTNIEKYKIKNSIFQIILFYLFNNITSNLIYDLIKFFIENFNEFYSEFLLLLLSYTGIEIRKEDPENLKIISTEVNKKYNNLKIENYENLSKIKFIVEMIEDIKLNKYLKFNLNEKFQFFKNFINKNINNDIKKGEKIEINLNDIKKINLNEIVKLNNNEIIETKNENELLNNIEIND
jgi:nucleolar MIF4G domain-containing protein 1